MKKFMSKIKKVCHPVVETVHPSDVTWKGGKETLRDSGICLAVSVVMAALLIGADTLFGMILSWIL